MDYIHEIKCLNRRRGCLTEYIIHLDMSKHYMCKLQWEMLHSKEYKQAHLDLLKTRNQIFQLEHKVQKLLYPDRYKCEC